MDAIVVIVMGVAGSGKSTVGEGLAHALSWRFIEGDAFHPETNRAKMARGQPLEDEDRWVWLARIRSEIDAAIAANAASVLACSALKRSYREVLRKGIETRTRVVYLRAERNELAARIARRKGHPFPVSLLDSQLATLEEPLGEPGILTVDAGLPVDAITRRAVEWLTREEPVV